jgi:small subunit ribosomal protein S20
MPNIKSAAKRMRQNEKRREANRSQRSTLRTAVKKTRSALQLGDLEATQAALPKTVSAVAKAAQKGMIHKNKAARIASRLSKAANALKAKQA